MSKTIDERVVSMEFDNSKFESNVKTSMSTLDKLKKSLNFDGVGKGFANIDRAASKVNIGGLSSAAEKVSLKFNAMQIAGVTAMTRITNKAIDTGERLVKSLSVDQIFAGWDKYIQKTSSVQTIMNATGKSINEVNRYLAKLMWFSDETSYSFTDMTASLGQLTSSGADIDKVIPMIMGVANATAYAGKGASEFSRAIYNLNQSYGAGHLQLMDWKSLELAGVASKQLKQTLIDTAVSLDKIKEGDVTIATFAESLSEKWADTEVMEKAFGKFAALTEAAYKAIEEGKFDTAAEAIEALSSQYDDVAVKAFKSAQEAKSFTEAVDATKDAVSSSWLRIMETIFGNYEEAKVFWTDLCGILWEIFVPGLEKINDVLDGAMTSKWAKIINKVGDAGASIIDFENLVKKNAKKYTKDIDTIIKKEGSLQKAFDKGLIKKDAVIDSLKEIAEATKDYIKSTEVSADKLKYFQKVVDEVWYGTWDNGHDRVVKLTEAGYDYNKVQSLVNKTVDGHRLTLSDLNDEQLKAIGYTEEEVKAITELAQAAQTAGTDLNGLINALEKPTGRELFTDAILTFLQGAKNMIDQVATAWNSIFGETTSDQIYSIAENLNNAAHSFEEFTNITSDKGSKIQSVLRGVFAIFDIIDNTVGYALVTSIRTLCKYLGMPVDDMLTMSAALGELAVKLNDWIWEWRKNSKFLKAFESFWTRTFFEMVNSVRNWVKSLWEANKIQPILKGIEDFLLTFSGGILEYVKGGAKAIGEFVTYLLNLKNFDFSLDSILGVFKAFRDKVLGYFLNLKDISIKDYIESVIKSIKGFIDSLRNLDGFSLSNIWQTIRSFFTDVLDKIFNLGKGAEKVDKYFVKAEASISNFAENGDNKISKFLDTMKELWEWLKTKLAALDGIGFGEVLSIGLGVGTIKLMKSLRLGIDGIAAVFKELIPLRQSISGVFTAMSGGINTVAQALATRIKTDQFVKKTQGILNLGIAIGILAGSLLVLSYVPSDKLWSAFGAIAALAGVLGALMLVSGLAGKIGKLGIDTAGAGKGLLALMGSLYLIIKCVQILANIETGKALANAAIVAVLMVVLTKCMQALSKTKNVAKNARVALVEMGEALLLISVALKVISSIRSDRLVGSVLAIVGIITALCGAMWLLSKAKGIGKNVSKTMLELGGALLLMTIIFKVISNLNMDKIYENVVGIGLVFGAFIGVMTIAKKATGLNKDIGIGMIAIAGSLLAIAIAMRVLGGMKPETMIKGGLAAVALMMVMEKVLSFAGNANKDLAKASLSLLSMAVAMNLLVVPIAIMSLIPANKLWKAVGAVSALMGMMGVLMMFSGMTQNANYKGLIGMSIAIGVMAASLGALAMIKPERLSSATKALASVMALFTLMEAASYLTKGSSLAVIGVIAVMLLEIVGVFILLEKLNINNALANAQALSVALVSIAGVTLLLGKFGKGSLAGAAEGALAIGAVVGILVAVFTALGTLFWLMDEKLGWGATEKLQKGLDLLATICEGIGRAIGSLYGGFTAGLTSGFEKIGENLSKFWNAAKDFFDGLDNLDQMSIDGAKAFATILKSLFTTSFNSNNLASVDTETIKTYLTDIGEALYEAIHDTKGLGGLSEDDKAVVTRASELFAAFSAIETPEDNLWAKLSSATLSLDTYAGQIKQAGVSLNEAFSADNFGSDLFKDDAIMTRVQTIADIFAAFAAVDVPNTTLFKTNIATFAGYLNTSAGCITTAFSDDKFGHRMFGTDLIVTKANNIASILTAFSDVKIPESGFFDDNIKKFASNLGNAADDIVSAISAFAEANITEDQINSAKNAASAISEFASISSKNFDVGNVTAFLNSLSGTYAEGGTGLLDKLTSQISNFSTIGTAKETIKNTAEALKSLINSCKPVKDVDCINLGNFSTTISTIATNFSTFATTVGGIDSTILAAATNNCDIIIAKIKELNGVDLTGAKSLGETLDKLAKDGIDKFLKKFSDSKTDVDDAIDILVNNVASSAQRDTSKKTVSDAFTELSKRGISAIKSLANGTDSSANGTDSFESAGASCVDGFILGVDNNLYKVTAAGTRIGDYAYEAAKKAIDSNSPAKKFIELGGFSGEGFVIGMDKMRQKVSASGVGMANVALNSIQDAIYRVSDIIQNDIDAQPTIRPIVDLSEAKLGARSLNSMFSDNTSFGLASQISRNRRNKVQSTNDDVVSAIKELGMSQGNNGNTYNINGITYDDGSNVAEAIRTIIRAARVERRS